MTLSESILLAVAAFVFIVEARWLHLMHSRVVQIDDAVADLTRATKMVDNAVEELGGHLEKVR